MQNNGHTNADLMANGIAPLLHGSGGAPQELAIVYTYTELSQASGKHLLQVSIVSVRDQMPDIKIHVLYHGHQDEEFILWLTKHGVRMHNHDPAWREEIESMRKNGNNPLSSHLFLHPGNYFGTWQRIDIPLMIINDTDHVLLLDADTIVLRPITIQDIGGIDDLSRFAIAMSDEVYINNQPLNAGVTLMNLPRLRETHPEFLQFILQHVHLGGTFNHPAPSDQGAYLDFYSQEVRYLDKSFNFKPYWELSAASDGDPFILHLHGAKPHDYMKHVLGIGCDAPVSFLCHSASQSPLLCWSMQHFARSSRRVGPEAYCDSRFNGDPAHNLFCNTMLALLDTQGITTAPTKLDNCIFSDLVRQVMELIPDDAGLSKGTIERNLLFDAIVGPPIGLILHHGMILQDDGGRVVGFLLLGCFLKLLACILKRKTMFGKTKGRYKN